MPERTRARAVKRVLFICSRNRLRSPTAEQVFSARTDLECSSAGLNHDAENPLTAELVEWAELIFVMERAHRDKLRTRFKPSLGAARVICLGIPDDYEYMDPELVRLLKRKVEPHLPQGPAPCA
ncbi:MAG: low molecular weight protein tyrosine phosphatase family protein [Xanthomonadales bacterium]|nr:low molecular weight protein tyrosine phosphatase family protein [Xanthomonadales bacterium]